MGEFPSWKQVETRWRTMVKQFKKTVDHNNKTGRDRKTCYFYEELSQILPNIVPELTISSSGLVNRKKTNRRN